MHSAKQAEIPASGSPAAAETPAPTLAGLLGRIDELEREKATIQQLRSDLLQAQTSLAEAHSQLAELNGSVDKRAEVDTSVGRKTAVVDRQQQEGLRSSQQRLVPGKDYPMFVAPDPQVVIPSFAWAQMQGLSHISKVSKRDAHTILDKLQLEEQEANDAFGAMIFGNPWHWLEAY